MTIGVKVVTPKPQPRRPRFPLAVVVALMIALSLIGSLFATPAPASAGGGGTYTGCGWGGSCVLGLHVGGTDQAWGTMYHETYNPYNGTYSYWGETKSYVCRGFGACYLEYRFYATGWNDHIYYAQFADNYGTAWFGYVGP